MHVASGAAGRAALSIGDSVAILALLFLAFAPPIPYVIFRHGLLAPLSLVAIAAIARGNGFLARLLSWPGFARMSEASFSLFALRMPAGVWYCVLVLSSPQGTSLQLVGMIVWTLGLSMIWSATVQNRLLKSLRRAERAKQDAPDAALEAGCSAAIASLLDVQERLFDQAETGLADENRRRGGQKEHHGRRDSGESEACDQDGQDPDDPGVIEINSVADHAQAVHWARREEPFRVVVLAHDQRGEDEHEGDLDGQSGPAGQIPGAELRDREEDCEIDKNRPSRRRIDT